MVWEDIYVYLSSYLLFVCPLVKRKAVFFCNYHVFAYFCNGKNMLLIYGKNNIDW